MVETGQQRLTPRQDNDNEDRDDNDDMSITHTVIMTFRTPQTETHALRMLEEDIRQALLAEGLPPCGRTELSDDGLRGRLLLECNDAGQLQRLVQPLLEPSAIVRHATGIFQVQMGRAHDVQVRALKND